jgi:hypothetical protein
MHCCPPCTAKQEEEARQAQLVAFLETRKTFAITKRAQQAAEPVLKVEDVVQLPERGYHAKKNSDQRPQENAQAFRTFTSQGSFEKEASSKHPEKERLDAQVEKKARELLRRRINATGSADAAVRELKVEMARTSLDDSMPKDATPRRRQLWKDEWVDPAVVRRQLELLEAEAAADKKSKPLSNFLD